MINLLFNEKELIKSASSIEIYEDDLSIIEKWIKKPKNETPPIISAILAGRFIIIKAGNITEAHITHKQILLMNQKPIQ